MLSDFATMNSEGKIPNTYYCSVLQPELFNLMDLDFVLKTS